MPTRPQCRAAKKQWLTGLWAGQGSVPAITSPGMNGWRKQKAPLATCHDDSQLPVIASSRSSRFGPGRHGHGHGHGQHNPEMAWAHELMIGQHARMRCSHERIAGYYKDADPDDGRQHLGPKLAGRRRWHERSGDPLHCVAAFIISAPSGKLSPLLQLPSLILPGSLHRGEKGAGQVLELVDP